MDARQAAVARIATRQYGLISREQARASGLSDRAIGRRVANGDWLPVEYGVYQLSGVPVTWHQRLLASCLAGPAVASHRSAARLWGFPVDSSEIVEVTALRHKRRHQRDVIWHESQRLEERYVATVDRIPVTTPLRTVIDLGVVLDLDSLEEALYGAMRKRLASIAGVERALDDLGALRRGRKVVRAALERARSHERVPDSRLETKFLQILRAAALPLPIAQYEVRAHDGSVIARPDFAYPEHRLLIELDGSEWHSIGIDLEHDHQRELRLRVLGNRMLRFGWDDLERRQQQVVDAVSAELSR